MDLVIFNSIKKVGYLEEHFQCEWYSTRRQGKLSIALQGVMSGSLTIRI